MILVSLYFITYSTFYERMLYESMYMSFKTCGGGVKFLSGNGKNVVQQMCTTTLLRLFVCANLLVIWGQNLEPLRLKNEALCHKLKNKTWLHFTMQGFSTYDEV